MTTMQRADAQKGEVFDYARTTPQPVRVYASGGLEPGFPTGGAADEVEASRLSSETRRAAPEATNSEVFHCMVFGLSSVLIALGIVVACLPGEDLHDETAAGIVMFTFGAAGLTIEAVRRR